MRTQNLVPFSNGFRLGRRAPLASTFLNQDINRLFEEFLGTDMVPVGVSAIANPKVDIKDTKKALKITAELPGVDEDDIDIELVDGGILLRGEKVREKEEDSDDEESGYHLYERSYGAFSRFIPVPFDVDEDMVEARFKRGVLHIDVHKPETVSRKTRKIAIKSS